MEQTDILKTLIGSRAHGLWKENSDYDYRIVYVANTSDILSLDYKNSARSIILGQDDNCRYEIGHFLMLALKNNPSILEVFVAPQVGEDVIIYRQDAVSSYYDSRQNINVTDRLRGLFKNVYDPKQAFNAFTGYANSQRKKLLDNHMNRRNKFATAYIRTLYNLIDLLETGTFSLKVEDRDRLIILKQLKYMEFHNGFVIDKAEQLTEEAKKLLDKAENKEYNPSIVNEFLIDVRRLYW